MLVGHVGDDEVLLVRSSSGIFAIEAEGLSDGGDALS